MFRLVTFVLIAGLVALLPAARADERDTASGPPQTFIVLVDVSGSMLDPFPAPIQPRLTDTDKLSDVKRRLVLLAQHAPLKTHLVVSTFDHETSTIFDGLLDQEADRNRLITVFESIKSREGSTYLWRTLDHHLERARKVVESKRGRCRVLLYSDGKDEEKKLTHSDIIAKHGENLSASVRLDFITIGYDVDKKVREDLSKAGVAFSKAEKPEDLIPVSARFKTSRNELRPNDELVVSNTSLAGPNSVCAIDFGDGESAEIALAGEIRHRYSQPGTYNIVLSVRSPSCMLDRYQTTVVVDLPAAMPAIIGLESSEYMIDATLVAFDRSVEPAAEVAWFIDGKIAAKNTDKLQIAMSQSGTRLLELHRTDAYGRKSVDTKEIQVTLPPKPDAVIRLLAEPKRTGEKVVFLNESLARSAFRWTIDGEEVESGNRHLEFTPDEPREYEVTLEAIDRYGQRSSVTKMVRVPKPETPVARILSPKEFDLGQAVVFSSQSSGLIERFQWNLNGTHQGNEVSLHVPATQLAPGRHSVELTVEGPGGTSSERFEFEIPLPPIPQARLRLAPSSKATIGTVFLVLNDTEAAHRSQWMLNGSAISDSHDLEWTPTQAGLHTIELIATDRWGQSTRANIEIDVPALVPPIAGFTIGSEAPYVGDRLTITDITQGDWDEVKFSIEGAEKHLADHTLKASDPSSRAIQLLVDQPGTVTIRQIAFGPGGKSRFEKSLVIASRKTAPLAKFSIEPLVEKTGTVVLEFLNECQGDASDIEFEPGDGTPVRSFAIGEKIVHRYGPGNHRARILVHSSSPDLPSASWVSEPIVVTAPMPAWLKISGLTALSLVMVGLATSLFRWLYPAPVPPTPLAGRLLVSRDGETRSFDLEENLPVCLTLDTKSKIRLASNSSEAAVRAELLIDDVLVDSASFDEEGSTQVGEFKLLLIR